MRKVSNPTLDIFFVGPKRWLVSVVVISRTCDQQVASSIPGHALPVSTWMGDCLWAVKPSWYVTSHLGQLSLPSLRGGQIEYRLLAKVATVTAGCVHLCRVEGNTV